MPYFVDRVQEFQSRWSRLQGAVQRRIELGHLYAGFHKDALDLVHNVDQLEALLATAADADKAKLEDVWAAVSQGYAAARHSGEKFLADSRAHRVCTPFVPSRGGGKVGRGNGRWTRSWT